MISTSRQLTAAPKRLERRLLKDEHANDIRQHYGRVDLMPAEYLVTHQESEPDRVHKLRALAKQRQAIRNAKRLKNSQRTN